MANATPPLNFDTFWNFKDPGISEIRFTELLAAATNPDDRIEIETQIARAQVLQRNFAAAHQTLDDVEKRLFGASFATQVRYLLERGRAYNSSNERAKARSLFVRAFEVAEGAVLDDLAVDAAHMMGIIEPPIEALKWNERAVGIAEGSNDLKAKGWLGSLYNNIGWTYYDKQNYPMAIEIFQRAEEWYKERHSEQWIRIARYSIGKTRRAMEQFAEALSIQECIAAEIEQKHLDPDGYVFEELAECHLALGRKEEAKPFFDRAYDLLSKDPWLAENEQKRLERLKELAGTGH
jgi:tetratricopeptide (TPR) repeat protein